MSWPFWDRHQQGDAPMPLMSEIPTLLLAEQATGYALSKCADHTREVVQLEVESRDAAGSMFGIQRKIILPAEEACGVFFLPQSRFANGPSERPTVAQFIPVENTHPHPRHHFEFEYEQMEEAIIKAYGGPPAGKVMLWHSHIASSRPSLTDHEMAEIFNRGMDLHPYWAPTPFHLVLDVVLDEWWWFDQSDHDRFHVQRFNSGV